MSNDDPNTWDEVTVRTPGWKATPTQVADFLRAMFPEDVILSHQRRVTEAGMREGIASVRTVFSTAVERLGHTQDASTAPLREATVTLVEGLLNMLDPDHEDFDGYFPSRLACSHHDTSVKPPHLVMQPVMSPCPGAPRCKAGSDIRETRR